MNFRASPAAVVDASPGTGVSACPARSARWRSNPDQEVLAGQLRGGQPEQYLACAATTGSGRERPDRGVQPVDHPEPIDQLGDRRKPQIPVNDPSGTPTRTRGRG